jgi:hypothetical protein
VFHKASYRIVVSTIFDMSKTYRASR